MKIFRYNAEVCPNCGAVDSFRRQVPDPENAGKYLYQGRSLKVGNQRRLYMACTKCLQKAMRITHFPEAFTK